MMIDKRNKNKGYTLFELLITISIIGFLVAVVLVSFNQSRIKSRDAKRKNDIAALRQALELYFHDNGRYPMNGAVGGQNSPTDIQNLASFLVPTYISAIPNDPKRVPENYEYVWGSGGIAMGIYVPFGNDNGTSCKVFTQGAINGWFGGSTPICSF